MSQRLRGNSGSRGNLALLLLGIPIGRVSFGAGTLADRATAVV